MAAHLRRHAGWSLEFQADVNARSAILLRRIATAVSHLQRDVHQAEAALHAAPSDDDQAERAALAEAKHKLALGLAGQREAEDTLRQLATHVRASTARSTAIAEHGSASLRRFWLDLERATHAFDSAVARLLGGSAGGIPSGHPIPSGTIGSFGHTLVDLSAIDDKDSRVTSSQDFEKASYQAIRTGLTRLEEVIIPAVRAGGGLDRMRELDERAGLADHPASYVRVYQAFFGDSSIVLARGDDGRLTVTNGYHRIWAARKAGVDALPARIRESP
jgi:hypothetical protein